MIYHKIMEIPIGKVTHYYDRAGVAVVALSSVLKVGERIKIKDHDQELGLPPCRSTTSR